jgi:hypothetical protein
MSFHALSLNAPRNWVTSNARSGCFLGSFTE